ncbi:C-5 sterol desaturase-like protein [Emericellopsis cladophorae]|uniref:C-5 sterol desaturase-like protein n=1 Tax=Emericellopsis cladophorae TaxID=2686198 RepID=A0A9P9XWM0_9HYPO|nr:C-5 sterol desaturase-like protein [Emericellopsis cladophorae]KAI6779203.1 C-5 sterol desaturase-like protein [Emericellopsis cladophorae]
MDIVLELTDTFIADYVYAWAHPAKPAPYDYPAGTAANTTAQTFSSWTWEPATQLLQFQPSQAAYMSAWTRDNVWRQLITLYFIVWIFGLVVYFAFASLSYYFIFDKRTLNHPKFIKNQIWLEILQANKSMPFMALCTAPLMALEVRGFSKLYDTTEQGPGMWYNFAQFPLFLVFTDFCIYWIHRYLHHPRVYKHLHKPHHKWIMPTPYASHAFHPLDGFAQSLPYHIFPFIFPLQKAAYVALFVFVNFWSILIHDGEYLTNNPVVNGAACHSLHHSRFEVNYGQFFTAFDRLGGTYRTPEAWMFEKEKKMSEKQWKAESTKVDNFVKEIEGSDDRTYDPPVDKKNI